MCDGRRGQLPSMHLCELGGGGLVQSGRTALVFTKSGPANSGGRAKSTRARKMILPIGSGCRRCGCSGCCAPRYSRSSSAASCW